MGFDVGVVPFNPDGWGPPDAPAVPPLLPPGSGGGGASTAQPAHVPFAPFSRSEKVGRIADWTRHAAFSNQGKPRGDSTVFDFALDESSSALALASADDDSSFRLVDAKPPPRPKFGPRWRFHQRPQLPQRRDEEVEARRRDADRDRARRDRLYHQLHPHRSSHPHHYHHRGGGASGGAPGGASRDSPLLKSSVDIQPEWTMLEQIPFSTFSKLSFSVADPPDDLLVCGALEFYDRSFDRLNPKNERRLERFKSRNFFKVTTTDDPVIRRLAADDKATVFATDAILAALMCAPRSVYSWDIVVQRVGNKLFLDKRDGSQLDLLTVNETASEPLPDAKEDINSPHSLAVEATYINQNFSQQVLVRDGNKLTFDEPNPFAADNEDVASVAYRYRRWKLDDDTYLIARCEVHAVSDVKGQRSFMTLNALNEFDPKYSGVDWRQKLETQRGAVLATELKNNANKLARWTAQALLASADLMKVGYVSRVHPRDHFNHVILGVFGYKPRDFAAQINLNTSNMWGIVKSIVDLCMKLGEGKYVLVKDPIKPQVRIYEVPADAFENDYVEEPLPEEEQVQPPAEDEVDETADIMDAAAEAEANAAAAAAPTSPAAEGGADAEKDASSPAS
ncbi:eukaryotic translation initiation factor 3 subunit D [Ananas comosus]|uniref:Eukaryotic translation initiation factor 3 subunit D n=1 Tax=Ananas comosus TaxID=4615 RepID=A0A199VZ00_ANACO|nr:eukaryotic translation initiation factor 3 subunit D [Ananas comosus]OAY82181.1 Eukaryotic translation initiation factor 3 subunit D [Ananas comosus]